jgi:hypothetical protein
VHDEAFAGYVAGLLAALPGVVAVSLGGSRAQGTHRPDSDWDFAIYYRAHFDPQALRDVGWPGEVFEVGGWGGGVFNGGAWLRVDDRQTDVHYRDLDSVEFEIAESSEGRFHIEPLMFHLVGIPSYLLVAELAMSRVLRGNLPKPGYPAALREQAPHVWWDKAQRTFGYARNYHASGGRVAECVGMIAQAASYTAHAVLAARGQWVTNDKTLLTRAGLREIDELVAVTGVGRESLLEAVDRSMELCSRAMDDARAG